MATQLRRSNVDLIGESASFLACLELLGRVAAHAVPLLLLGETGTGKELIARQTHHASPRRGRSFIPVNCGALPEDLFVNEVFGHRRGAFTGADRDSDGLVTKADGGTLFLDEIDSLGPRAQVALLRFLQDGSFRRLGGERERVSDIRIVAATNADLDVLSARGLFRKDLLYRIDVVRIVIPPLRERGDDVLLLARHFVRHFAELYDQTIPQIDASLASWLVSQPWPGNVRELENVLHRLFFTCEAGHIVPPAEETGGTRAPAGSFNTERAKVMCAFERRYLTELMVEVGGNISEAARRAGKERTAFKRLMKKHGIRGGTVSKNDERGADV